MVSLVFYWGVVLESNVLMKADLQLLFCLCFFVLHTSKAIRGSTRKLKSQEPVVPLDGLTLDLPPPNADTASVLRSRREESCLNAYNCSVFNFSTVTVIAPLGFDKDTVANFQWIGNPPYHVSQVKSNVFYFYQYSSYIVSYFYSV